MASDSGRVRPGNLYGSLEMLILKALSVDAPMHGLEIARFIKESSRDALIIEEGALYPALHRLAAKGLVEGEWLVSEKGRRAKFYDITASGHRTLEAELDSWTRHQKAVGHVITARKASQ